MLGDLCELVDLITQKRVLAKRPVLAECLARALVVQVACLLVSQSYQDFFDRRPHEVAPCCVRGLIEQLYSEVVALQNIEAFAPFLLERNIELHPEVGAADVPHWQNGRVDQVREARPHEVLHYLAVHISCVIWVCESEGGQE